QANQFGTVPRTGTALTMRGGGAKIWNLGQHDSISEWRRQHTTSRLSPRWQAEVGAETVINLGGSSQILLPEAYGSIRYGNLELFAGRRKQWFGLADSTLGMGSYIWSGNALPIPRIQLSLTRFTAVPFTQGWFSVLGSYSDGWFEGTRPVTSELKLHQKQFYGRLGRPGGKFKLYAGFNHQVQWGGKSPYETINGQMPKGLKNYFKVIFGRNRIDTLGATDFDNMNRVGNHLGTIDLAFEIDGSNANWFFYRQNIYEDGSLYYLTNISDGLNGVRIRRKNADTGGFSFKELVFEGLYTKSQGGPSFIMNEDKKRGKDNYFNNTQVRDGWSYCDRAIGTPFIPPTSQTIWKYPNYADAFTSNNRVWAFHLGLQGDLLRRTQWMSKLSVSSNKGVYDLPFANTVYQFSGLVALQTRIDWLGGMIAKGSVATDYGGLYPNSVGVMFSLRKEFGSPPSAIRPNYLWR
uniref:capsule assembly Wzi family protein n=1 Tax=Persicitalea sp. TaxID=3100273 RepID=UPI003593C740